MLCSNQLSYVATFWEGELSRLALGLSTKPVTYPRVSPRFRRPQLQSRPAKRIRKRLRSGKNRSCLQQYRNPCRGSGRLRNPDGTTPVKIPGLLSRSRVRKRHPRCSIQVLLRHKVWPDRYEHRREKHQKTRETGQGKTAQIMSQT